MFLNVFTLLVGIDDAIGIISPPPGTAAFGSGQDALIKFFNLILRLVFLIAGLYGFINLIMAGFGFLGAGGDAKVVGKSWEKIWQSFMGLLFIVGSFLLAAIMGKLFFGDFTYILSPKFTP
ncbi:MAG: hypothetical protein UU37_C0003G0007 [Candidatus Gottesmanbacteria bacterium GW2011_GWA2_41_12]|uniref:Uncharacterized protein n=2 Tax=Candidatus Gottesmaniibacteriota TaxID=1752720 RepID=A0A0G0UHX1_9BACT|nr:MAG: hypothetical protein UT63_C0014G0008 [Candidatus Gottesmanbacteria bacterium GW2011_GWC2_39_8]KKR88433.1 MAG: hypothetical protein UU37_C0003G0007 [Candidatus Gottesmanbacteria bacterium GW2011_GWA2_41_12]